MAADRLRDSILAYDADSCVAEAEAVLRDRVVTPRLRAWAGYCLAEVGRVAEAETIAATMQQEQPGAPWAEFMAIAVALAGDRAWEPALDGRSAALVDVLDHRDDALRLRANYLLVNERHDDVLALIEAHPESRALSWARVWALFLRAFNETAQRPAAIAEASAIDAGSDAVIAGSVAAYWLNRYDRAAEALPHIDRALAISPRSVTLHKQRWEILHALQRDRPEVVTAAIAAFLELRPDTPSALAAAAAMYREVGRPDPALALEARLLTEFVDSAATESMLFERLLEGMTHAGSPTLKLRAEQQARLAAFLARPRMHRPQRREQAAILQFDALSADPNATPEALLAAVEAMVTHVQDLRQPYTYGVLALVERTPYFARAEALARQGLVALDPWMAERSGTAHPEALKEVRNDMTCTIKDALGAALLAEGRLDEAETVLREALALGPKYVPTHLHLATLARRRGDLRAAEAHLLASLPHGSQIPHPGEVALELLYRDEHGSKRGFPRYFARLTATQREARRLEVLAGAVVEPALAPAFSMVRLDGERVSSEQLRGKIAVIKFWYTGCDPCVQELPEFQALADAYARDPEVEVLSIYNNGEQAEVTTWMREHGYRFDVLLAGTYCEDHKIQMFPTVWVLDREGRIAFTTVGTSPHLREEFAWRVESLRGRTG